MREVVRRLRRLIKAQERRLVRNYRISNVIAVARIMRVRPTTVKTMRRLVRAVSFAGLQSPEFASATWVKWWLHHNYPSVPIDVDSGSEDAWVPLGMIGFLLQAGPKRPRVHVGMDKEGYDTTALKFASWTRDLKAAVARTREPASNNEVQLSQTFGQTPPHILFSVRHSSIDDRVQRALIAVAQDHNLNKADLVATHEGLANYTAIGTTHVHKVRLTFLSAARPVTLWDEWVILLQLQGHPGICRAVEFSGRENWQVMITRRIRGKSLSEYVEENRPGYQSRRRLILQLADLSGFLRHRGIAQLDFHPRNFLVTEHEQIKAIDFDWAVTVDPRDFPFDRINNPKIPHPLQPLTSETSLIQLLEWEDELLGLHAELQELWSLQPTVENWSLNLLGHELSGIRDLFSYWHALLSVESISAAQEVGVVGRGALMMSVLLTISGKRVYVAGSTAVAVKKACDVFGVDIREVSQTHGSQPEVDAVVDLGSMNGDSVWDRDAPTLFRSQVAVVSVGFREKSRLGELTRPEWRTQRAGW